MRARFHTHACMPTYARTHAHTHACTHTHARAHAHAHAHTHARTHAHAHTHAHTHTYARMYTHARTHTCTRTRTRRRARTRAHTHACPPVNARTHMHACKRTHTHARMYTHARTRARTKQGFVGKSKQKTRQGATSSWSGGSLPLPHNAIAPSTAHSIGSPREALYFQVRPSRSHPIPLGLRVGQLETHSPLACAHQRTFPPSPCLPTPCTPAQLKEFEEFRCPRFNVLYVQTPRPEFITRPIQAFNQVRSLSCVNRGGKGGRAGRISCNRGRTCRLEQRGPSQRTQPRTPRRWWRKQRSCCGQSCAWASPRTACATSCRTQGAQGAACGCCVPAARGAAPEPLCYQSLPWE